MIRYETKVEGRGRRRSGAATTTAAAHSQTHEKRHAD